MKKRLNIVVLITVLLSLIPVGYAHAEAEYVLQTGSANPFNGVDLGDHSAPAFVDIDCDGDMDAFIGNELGFIRYFENIGNRIAPTFVERTNTANPMDSIDVGWHSTPTFVDIDGDGDMDAFSGRDLGTIAYYENTGNALSPTFTHRVGVDNPLDHVDAGEDSTLNFADIDLDGDKDIYIGEGQFLRLYLAINTGSTSEPSFGTPNVEYSFTGQGDPAPALADYDLDGDFDLFVGTNLGAISMIKNIGDANFRNMIVGMESPIHVSVYHNTKPAFVDIDSDGDLDVFFGEQNGTIGYFKNVGENKKHWWMKEITGASNPFNGYDVGLNVSPAFVDIDSDGDQDAFIGKGGGFFSYYKNTVLATAPDYLSQTGLNNPMDGINPGDHTTPVFVDINKDGDMDAFSGEFYGELNFIENTGNVVTPTFTLQDTTSNPLSVDVGFNSAPSFADIDGDGDQDAFVGELFGSILFYRNDGDAIDPNFGAVLGTSNPFDGVTVGSLSKPTFCDVDVDGDMDAFIGESGGAIQYFENTGTALHPTFTQRTGSANPFNGYDVGSNSTPAVVDIDADGDCDAFVGELSGTLKFFENIWLSSHTYLPLTISSAD